MEAIIKAMSDAFTLVGTVITNITGQPVLLFFLAASLIPVGIRIFRSLKLLRSKGGVMYGRYPYRNADCNCCNG